MKIPITLAIATIAVSSRLHGRGRRRLTRSTASIRSCF